MAGTIDHLKYILGLDIKGFQANAKRAEAQVSKTTGAITSSLKRIAAVAIAAFGAYKVTGLIKDMTLMAARAEELKIVLGSVGKVSGYTSTYLAQQEQVIRSLGITTQAARMLMIRFMQSQMDVAKAAKIARAAQDFAVIGMMDSSEAAKMLTFAISAQRPRLLRQFGIVTDLAEVFNKYAKTVGKSAEDLTEHEKRMSFYNVIMENAARITGTYEAAMMTAGKQFRSLQRYVIEASNAIGKHLLPAFGHLVNLTTNSLKGIRALFDPIGAMTDSYYKLNKRFNETSGSVHKLVERYEELSSKITPTREEHEELNRIMDKLVSLMPTLSREYDEYGNILSINIDSLHETVGLHQDLLGVQKEWLKLTLPKRIEEIKRKVADEKIVLDGLLGVVKAQPSAYARWGEGIDRAGKNITKFKTELIELERQLRIVEPLYDLAKPLEDSEIKKAIEPLSKALYTQMIWKLSLDRKYEKTTLIQYKEHLQNILSIYKLTEEQKLDLKQKIVEIGYAIDKKALDEYETNLTSWQEKVKDAWNDILDEIETINENRYQWLYEHEQISVNQYLAFLRQKLVGLNEYSDAWIAIQSQIEEIEQEQTDKRTEQLEDWQAANEEVLDALLVGYDTYWNTILDMDMSGAERRKAIFESMAQAIINVIADQAKDEIKLALGVQAVKEGAKKSELRTFMVASAKTMAVMAKEAAMALASAAKWIYQAVAKIFSAHAGIPFVGVAIAGAIVGAMMASIGKFKKFAEGGLVEGLLAGQDQLLALLTKGEFVMPGPAVAAIGVPALEHMRRTGEVPGRSIVNIDMGGFTFYGTKKEDVYLIESFVEDKIVETIEKKLESRDLVI